MNLTALLIALLAFLAIVLVVPAWLRHRSEAAMLRLIGDAMQRGEPLDPAVLDRLLARPAPALGKGFAVLCFGMALLALGVGFALLAGSLIVNQGPGMVIGGVINTCVGVGYLVLGAASLRLFTGRRRPPLRLGFTSVLALLCLFLGVAAVSVGVGLAAAAPLFYMLDDSAGVSALTGALVNLGPGIGLIALAVVVLRVFDEVGDD